MVNNYVSHAHHENQFESASQKLIEPQIFHAEANVVLKTNILMRAIIHLNSMLELRATQELNSISQMRGVSA